MAERLTNFSLERFFTMLANGSYESVNTGYGPGLPAVYCGYLTLLCVLLYFLARRIPLREKLCMGMLLVFLFCGMYFYLPNILWHGSQPPTFFPYRQSFLFSFQLLYLAIRALTELPVDRLPVIWQRRPLFELLLTVILAGTALDMGVNGKQILFAIDYEFVYDPVQNYDSFILSNKPVVEEMKKRDKGLYRVNSPIRYTMNECLLLGYNGLTHYSSAYNEAVNRFMGKFGLWQDYIWCTGEGATPLVESILGVKYIMSESVVSHLYRRVETESAGVPLYENPLALPLVYSAPVRTLDPEIDSDDPFVNQNRLLSCLAGQPADCFTIYEPLESKEEDSYFYTFTSRSSGSVYLYLQFSGYAGARVLVNGERVTSYSKYAVCLGDYAAGEELQIEVTPQAGIVIDKAMIGQLDAEKLVETLSALQQGGMAVELHQGASLQGTIPVSAGETILTSIPYDEGWTVTIDGRRCEPECFAGAFLAVKADAGYHEIGFSYHPAGLRAGLAVGGISLIFTILYLSCHLSAAECRMQYEKEAKGFCEKDI